MHRLTKLFSKPSKDLPLKRKKILITLSSGGFGFQCYRIIQNLEQKCDFIYMTNFYGRSPKEAKVPEGFFYRVPEVQTVTNGSKLTTIWSLLVTYFKTLFVLLKYRPNCVISISMPQGVAMLLAARTLGIETIYFESITRVKTPSNTTKLCLFLNASKNVFVQWEQLVPKVKGSRFGGRVI